MPAKSRTVKTEGIVLQHRDWGEADRLITLYTRELGKIRAIAKGIRKPRSRKSGHLQPLSCTSIMLARGRDLYILTQAETLNAFLNIRESLLTIGYGVYMAEIVDRFIYEEGQNKSIYMLLLNSLERLDNNEDPNVVNRYFEIRLLDQLGFRPQLFNCTSCSSKILPEDQYFSANLGGILCPNCGMKEPASRPLSLKAIKYLRHFQRSGYDQARVASISPQIQSEMEQIMQHYLTYHLERGLHTPSFVNRMRKNQL